ncbi:MAG: type II toxin-antitoxin system HipA family toxin YjjJ [Victivallales bacterium]
MDRQETTIEFEFRRKGVLTARELAAALDASQPTVSRLLARFKGRRIQRIGNARSTRYALSRNIPVLGSDWPIYEIDLEGKAHLIGNLHALEAKQWFLEQESPWTTLLGEEFPDGLYPDFPWFLDDLRPRGFLGRTFARKYGKLLGLSADPCDWMADDVVTALLRYGQNLQGSFIIGQEMLSAVQESMLGKQDMLTPASRNRSYPSLADAMLAGEWPGSSAAGEQPKFTTCINDKGSIRHVIVKFNGNSGRSEDKRWADLLVSEHLAARILADAGIASAKTQLIEAGGRHFLESTRFDREGAYGRKGLVSLAALDSAFFGYPDTPWTAAAERLQRTGWLSSEDADRLSVLWWFGTLIGNTDMHYGNVSLCMGRNRPLALAPSYDMLPMFYRPNIEGSLPERPIAPPAPPPESARYWTRASALATTFWANLSNSSDASSAFRKISKLNLDVIAKYRRQFV